MQIISAVKAPLSALLRHANVRNQKKKEKKMQIRLLRLCVFLKVRGVGG